MLDGNLRPNPLAGVFGESLSVNLFSLYSGLAPLDGLEPPVGNIVSTMTSLCSSLEPESSLVLSLLKADSTRIVIFGFS